MTSKAILEQATKLLSSVSALALSFFNCLSIRNIPQLPHLLSAARSRLRKAASTSSRSTRLCCGATLSRWLSRSSERLESVRLSRQMLCSSSPARAVLWRMGEQVVGNMGILAVGSWAQLLVPHCTRCVSGLSLPPLHPNVPQVSCLSWLCSPHLFLFPILIAQFFFSLRVKRNVDYSHKTALSATRGPVKQVATSVGNA